MIEEERKREKIVVIVIDYVKFWVAVELHHK